jgi:DNA-binding response OmpR family regulator
MDDSLAGKTLLIVEDDAVLAMGLEGQLAEAGATVILARTSEEALGLTGSTRFDAAVLDVHLRDGNSYAIADALRLQETPFVFLSGYLTIRVGYTDIPFVPKPYSVPKLIAAIAGLFGPKP